jgi:hypothetical protein
MRMGRSVHVRAGDASLVFELRDTPTADAVWDALPLESRAAKWGGELYFEVPVLAEREDDAREVLEIGELCYWVEGSSLVIFFGPTPNSRADEPRAVVPVNVVGLARGSPDVIASALGRLEDGVVFRLEKDIRPER